MVGERSGGGPGELQLRGSSQLLAPFSDTSGIYPLNTSTAIRLISLVGRT